MGKLFSIASCMAISIALICVFQWFGANPFANGWDEADYINQVVRDDYRAEEDGVVGFAKNILAGDRARPPGYRLLAAPVGLVFELSPTNLRLLSFIAFLLSASLIYFSCRFFLDTHSSLLGGLFFVLSVGPLSASMHFGMEAILYPAVAGFFFAIVRIIHAQKIDSLSNWLLAVSLVTGGLSKTSFLLIAFPALGFLGLLVAMKLVSVSRPWMTLILGLLTVLILLPWWIYNFSHAVSYTFYASSYVRHQFPWGSEALTSLSGPYLSLLFGVITLVGLFLIKRPAINSPKVHIFAACAAGILPILLGHIWGQNHNMRLLTPALIPLSILIAITSSHIKLWSNYFFVVLVIALVAGQTFFIANHVLDKTRDPWDWRVLKELSDKHGFFNPRVSHLGNAQPLNPSAIQRLWLDQKQPHYEIWLWRYEDGPIDWNIIDQKIENSDVVITGPSITGSEKDGNSLDNLHNTALIERMKTNQRFHEPQMIEMGRLPTLLYIYFRKSGSE